MWLAGAGLLALGFVLASVLLPTRTSLVCDRAAGSEPVCALIVRSLLHETREAVAPRSYSVHVQDALLGGGMRPTLGIHPIAGGIRWFRLGARNEAIEAAWRDYFTSSTPHFETQLESQATRFSYFALLGLCIVVVLITFQSRTRIDIDLEDATLRATTRGLLARRGEMVLPLADIVSVVARQQSDSSISTLYATVGELRHVIGEAGELRADAIADELNALLQKWRKRGDAASGADDA